MQKKGKIKEKSSDSASEKNLVLSQLKQVIDDYKTKHKLNIYEIVDLALGKEIPTAERIPLSIFSNKLSCFETVVKYLRENCRLKFNEIAVLTGRNISTIITTYHKAAKKLGVKLEISSSKYIPIEIIKKKTLGVLESIVVYLRDSGMKFSEIAVVLHRDQRTVWTAYSRAGKKGEGK